MAGNPSRWSPATVIICAMCGEAMCASRSACDYHTSMVTNAPGADSEANRQIQRPQPITPNFDAAIIMWGMPPRCDYMGDPLDLG